jgi:hypothetical protein
VRRPSHKKRSLAESADRRNPAMPIQYRIDSERGRIRTACIGDVTLDEVLAHFDELERDPKCPPHLDVLLDLTAQESPPRPDQLRSAAERIGAVSELAFGLCAIVTSSESMFGLLRMFEVYAEPHFEQLRVFRDAVEAEAWLDAERAG